eukprot:TRINITY_DN943_c0_g2_i3.p1 TRINITY_DN943_c0_g2~~TRINITY_DN943_c0_g2_i3.p1  ORF type:complete len:410 (-),score=115.79 TRINITY_DN943_c0_g2_i3:22-1251(-)
METTLNNPLLSSINLPESKEEGKSVWWRAAFNIFCTVVGTGLLGLPKSLQWAGWVGLVLLVVLCVFSVYTAVILIKCMEESHSSSYAEVGRKAYGRAGKYFVTAQIHMTLLGVATVYVVLAGLNINTLFPSIPARAGSCIAVAAVWGHIFFKTLHEVGILSAFNVLVATMLLIVVIISVFLNPPADSLDTSHKFFNPAIDFFGAFANFAFAFGAHPVLPSVYNTMQNPKDYNKTIYITFLCILLFYFPMGVIGYYAYGEATENPIYSNFPDGAAKTLIVVSVTVHILFSYAVVINPTELDVEAYFEIEGKSYETLRRMALRTILVGITLGLGVAIPDFPDFMTIVSSLTSSFTAFILPCLFYLKIFEHKITIWGILWNFLIIWVALEGAVFGCYFGVKGVLSSVFNITE